MPDRPTGPPQHHKEGGVCCNYKYAVVPNGLDPRKGPLLPDDVLGGLTQDGESSPANPGGQGSSRRFSLFKPRLPDKHRMFLAAAIAHPRIWTPQEKGLLEGVHYLLGNGPKLLLEQIALIGSELAETNNSIFIKSNAPSGLLYLFVNDVWQTAGNNSGGPRLSIEPVEGSEATGVLFTLEHRIEIDTSGKQNETNKWKRSIVPPPVRS